MKNREFPSSSRRLTGLSLTELLFALAVASGTLATAATLYNNVNKNNAYYKDVARLAAAHSAAQNTSTSSDVSRTTATTGNASTSSMTVGNSPDSMIVQFDDAAQSNCRNPMVAEDDAGHIGPRTEGCLLGHHQFLTIVDMPRLHEVKAGKGTLKSQQSGDEVAASRRAERRNASSNRVEALVQ